MSDEPIIVALSDEPAGALSDNERKVLASLRQGDKSLQQISERSGLRKLHITRIIHALASRGCITLDTSESSEIP